jgi:2-keto-3-deoxy-L-rhamnonate aldolase RhmA
MTANHPLQVTRKDTRAQLTEKSSTIGLFIVSASPLVVEACAMCDLDWLVFDQEASPTGRSELTQMLQAINGARVLGFARIAANTPHNIEAALDAGVHGVIVPKVSNRSDAEAAVRGAKYPPMGARGLNPIRCSGYFSTLPGYFQRANSETMLAVQIETAEALKNLDAIAAVTGVEMLFVGCGDLAAELGHIGDVEHPDVHVAIVRVLEACRRASKIAGIFAYSGNLARKYRDIGYNFIAIGNDLKFLLSGIDDAVGDYRR